MFSNGFDGAGLVLASAGSLGMMVVGSKIRPTLQVHFDQLSYAILAQWLKQGAVWLVAAASRGV
jgi:hypothetical protein